MTGVDSSGQATTNSELRVQPARDRAIEWPTAGEILGDELDARGWSRTEFAARLALSTPAISDIITGRKLITPRLAKQIASALGTSAEMWENLRAIDQKHERAALAGGSARDRAIEAVLVARCENVTEADGTPCPGRLRYHWGQSDAACDTCGGRCGIAVANWERVEPDAGAPDTPPADELDELDISGGPEHRVKKHWDHEGGEVIWRSCSCGHDWTTADVEVCPEAPYADDEHGVAWSTIKSLAARVDRHEVDEHEAADVIVRALRAGAGAS